MITDNKVLFSVIIPTCARKKMLKRCCQGLTELLFAREHFEVIIVNDNPAVSLQSTVTPFEKHIQFTCATTPNVGPAAARNHGAGLARGKYLVFTDDDCVPESSWLKYAIHNLGDSSDCAIAGKVVNALADNGYAVVNQHIYDALFAWHNVNPLHARFGMSNNLFIPAAGFEALNGFDADFQAPGGEDRDFTSRWRNAGYILRYDAAVKVFHYQDLSFTGFIKKHFAYGRGSFLYEYKKSQYIKENKQLTIRQKAEKFPPGRLWNEIFRPGIGTKPVSRTLLLLSQIMTAIGYFLEKQLITRKDRRRAGRSCDAGACPRGR